MACLDRRTLCILSQAHAVALAAIAGVNLRGSADDLAAMADQLPEDDPLREQIARFRAVQDCRHPDLVDLAEAGRALRQAVSLHLMPAPVGRERADIHG